MHLRELAFLLLLFPGRGRRISRTNDFHLGAQQQKDKVANGLEVSDVSREALIPGEARTGLFRRAGPRAAALRDESRPDGRRAGQLETHRTGPDLPMSSHNLPRRQLLSAAAAGFLLDVPRPATAVIGETLGAGFTQADDKSWDFTLPSPAWKLNDTPPRAEYPEKLFHVVGARTGSDAKLDLSVVPDGAKSPADLGTAEEYGKSLLSTLPPPASLESAEVLRPQYIIGVSSYKFKYKTASGTTLIRVSASQGRTYTLTVSLPTSASADVQAEAAELVDSFKTFAVNIICLTQSRQGSTPFAGSCY